MKIIKPIFIIGTGRCGSTIFHKVFCQHPQIAWLSGLCNRLPKHSNLNRTVLKMQDLGLLRGIAKKWIYPSETTLYWEYLAPGFSTSIRDIFKEDVKPNVKNRVIQEMEIHLTKKRNRQLHKLTGWPKVGYVFEIFPDAFFIHIYRDGRAVANSLLNTDWWLGWRGPENWIWGRLPSEYQSEWESSGRSFIVLAAIQWKMLMDSFEYAKKLVPQNQHIEIKYEDFMGNPESNFKNILDFCELDNSKNFFHYISKLSISSRNEKWKNDLSAEQQQQLQDSLKNHLRYYGYI